MNKNINDKLHSIDISDKNISPTKVTKVKR